DPRLAKVQIDVACHIHNVLCGPQGVARIYGPKKGASPAVVEQLAHALDHYAEIIKRDLGEDVSAIPGGGASGGLGTGLYALLGARLYPSYTIVIRYLDSLFHNADLVITAEDDIDCQTPRGSIPTEVARHARRYGLPVITLAGSIGRDARVNYNHGIAAFMSIIPTSCTPDQAAECAFEWAVNCAENVMRMVLAGRQITQRPSWPMLTPHQSNNGVDGTGQANYWTG
ncbi:MAG: glycerate kinase, partial [Chloroflexales bacterium]|nr:glycerate kinase [Chloroflexales bacterium]